MSERLLPEGEALHGSSGVLGARAIHGTTSNAGPNHGSGVGAAIAKSWRSLWSMPGKPTTFLGWPAATFILTQLLVGLPLLPYALLHWRSENMLRFTCFFGVALAASLFKVRLPGIEATMSANFLFVLVGILDLSYAETLVMGCFGGLAQSLWQSKPLPRLIQILFNFANLAISISLANLVFHSHAAYNFGLRLPLLLAGASTTYFAINTMSVSAGIAMTARRKSAISGRFLITCSERLSPAA